MNRKRLLVIGALAAAIGGGASWYAYHSLEAKFGALRSDGTDVVVAARDINVGARIADRDLRVVNYRTQFLPVAVLHKKEAALGLVALLPISRGEFVLPYKMDIGGDRLTSQIPVGMRAVPLPVNELESSLIKPGDRVDVLVTGNAPGSNDTQTRTVVANVRLLEIGSRSVTLVVSPEDAEKLTLAMQEGRVKLIFRNPGDPVQENTPAITRTTLYGGVQPRKPWVVKPIPPAIPEASPYIEIEVIHGTRPPETIKLKQ